MSAGNWCLIESDPGVFTELIHKFGVRGVQVDELWSLDKEQLSSSAANPVFGLVFLFKWVKELESGNDSKDGDVVSDSRADKMFFARQVINNACATQAILSVLLNADESALNLGNTLKEFKEFCGSFDASMKGLTLSNSEEIRTVHNSFARQNLFEFDAKAPTKDDDVFHFVSYVPIDGRLYELDGLQEGPIDHGAVNRDGDWLDAVRPIIEKRMAKYSQGEIHFNLMALVQDKLQALAKQAEEMTSAGNEAGLADVQLRIAEEEARRSQWKKENIRRRHNYLPFIVELLKGLAAEGQLLPVYEKAKEKALKQKEQKEKRKEEAKAN